MPICLSLGYLTANRSDEAVGVLWGDKRQQRGGR
jgi:hypothetical protein